MSRKSDIFSNILVRNTFIVCLAVLSGFRFTFCSLPYDFKNDGEIESVVFTSEDNGTDSLGQLYLRGSSMVVIYQLRYRNNDTKYNRNYLVRRYSNQGMKPNIRFWNLTWNTSFELKDLIEEDTVYWKKNITITQLLQDSNYISGNWRFLVEMGQGLNLFERTGSLIIKYEEPLLNVNLGDLATNAIPLKSEPNDVIIRQSPCSPGVAAIVPVVNTTEHPYSGCYLGVTHNYFSPSSVTWFNLLHLSSATPDKYSICKQNVFSKCSNLSIIDFALLKNQLLFVTTSGITVSCNLSRALKNGSGTKLSFTSLLSVHPDIDKALSTGSLTTRGDIKLFHTPRCLSSFASDNEEVCIVYRNHTLNSSLSVCSYPPFEKWRAFVFESAPERHSVLDIVHDIQRENTVVLMIDMSKEVTLVQVYNGSKLSFPAFIFDKGEAVERLHFHAYTEIIYAYGSQVWQSLDGGNSFNKATSLHKQDKVTSFSTDLFGDTFCLSTRLGSIHIGKGGIYRTTVIKNLGYGLLGQPVHSQVVSHVNTVTLLKVQSIDDSLLLHQDAFEIKHVTESKHALPLSLLVSFRTETKVDFFANSDVCSDCFSSSMTGQVIHSRYGGSALISRVEKTSGLMSNVFNRHVVGHVLEPFNESQESITDLLLQISWSGWNATLSLLSAGADINSHWQEEDLGKTVMLPQGQSFILKYYVNETFIVGSTYVPWMGRLPLKDIVEGWTIYDFRDPILNNFTWWVNEDVCQTVLLESRELSPRFYHLDSRDNLTFTATSVSRKIPTQLIPRVLISNPRVFTLSSESQHSFLNTTLKVQLSQKPSATGSTTIFVLLQDSSLFCTSTSFTISIHSGCPPSKKLHYIYPLSFPDSTFLDSKAIDSKGIKRNFILPYNYRPPSARGKAIPMTKNIYNVDPKQPHYKDIYAITRETVRYKQCEGAKERTDCGCTRAMRRSSLERYSDCIDTVYRLLFTEKLMPKFIVSRDEHETITLDSPYYLKELNQRLDYEILNPSNKIYSGIASIIMEEKMNSTIEFIGSGLYHFKAYVVRENYTFCELTDEFVIFVVDTPLPYPVKDIVMACTAMGFSAMLYLIYLLHFHGKKKIKYD